MARTITYILIGISIAVITNQIISQYKANTNKPVILYETVKTASDNMVDSMIELYSVNGIDFDPNYFNDNTEKDLKEKSLNDLIKLLESKGYTIK